MNVTVAGPHYEALRTGQIALTLKGAWIEIGGADHFEWLMGQCTQDLRQLTEGQAMSAALCMPTGQILAEFDIQSGPNCLWVWTSPEGRDHLLHRVEQTVIMEDVHARVLNPSGTATAIFPSQDFHAQGLLHQGEEMMIAPFGRLGHLTLERTGSVTDDDSLEVLRMEAGRVSVERDAPPKTLAPELGPEFVHRAISYRKGCYTGQEVIMRIYSRGHTNRTWRILKAERPMPVGTEVIGIDGAVAGRITSSVVSPDKGPLVAGILSDKAVADLDHVTLRGQDSETLAMWYTPAESLPPNR